MKTPVTITFDFESDSHTGLYVSLASFSKYFEGPAISNLKVEVDTTDKFKFASAFTDGLRNAVEQNPVLQEMFGEYL